MELTFYIVTFPLFCFASSGATHPSFSSEFDASMVTCEGECPPDPVEDDCDAKCGCDRAYFFDETTGNCLLSPEFHVIMVEKYNTEETLSLEADRVFQGIIGSAILFLTCTVVCVFAACFYCCRMHHTDSRLKSDVKALAKKQGRDMPKPHTKTKTKYPPISDSCTVVVEDAGVCVM